MAQPNGTIMAADSRLIWLDERPRTHDMGHGMIAATDSGLIWHDERMRTSDLGQQVIDLKELFGMMELEEKIGQLDLIWIDDDDDDLPGLE